MSATKEQLTERLNALRVQRDQLIANANACSGAIQAVESILEDHYADEKRIVEASAKDVAQVEKVRDFPKK